MKSDSRKLWSFGIMLHVLNQESERHQVLNFVFISVFEILSISVGIVSTSKHQSSQHWVFWLYFVYFTYIGGCSPRFIFHCTFGQYLHAHSFWSKFKSAQGNILSLTLCFIVSNTSIYTIKSKSNLIKFLCWFNYHLSRLAIIWIGPVCVSNYVYPG